MRIIELTQKKVALVDDIDYEWLCQWKWRASQNNSGKQIWYAVTGDKKRIFMHRLIMGTPNGMEVDHRDGDGLNNQRFNLRNCTRSQNARNQRMPTTNKSGYKGVSWHKATGKWQSGIKLQSRIIYLGCFDDPVVAAQTYDAKAIELFGEFASLNFPITS